METVIHELRKAVHKGNFPKVLNWLFIRSHDVNANLYKDFDLFAVVNDQENLFELTVELSAFSVELTLQFGKHVSIYPIHTSELVYRKNQFLKNISTMSEIL